MSWKKVLVIAAFAQIGSSIHVSESYSNILQASFKLQNPRTLLSQPSPHSSLRLRGGSGKDDDIDLREAASKVAPNPVTQWVDENFPVESRKELGHACLGFGSALLLFILTPLPVIGCFLNRTGLLLGNLLLASGVLLSSGHDDARRFLFAPKRRPGSFTMLAGFLLIYKRWVFLGVMMELLGFLSLFGPFMESFLSYLSPFVPTSLRG